MLLHGGRLVIHIMKEEVKQNITVRLAVAQSWGMLFNLGGLKKKEALYLADPLSNFCLRCIEYFKAPIEHPEVALGTRSKGFGSIRCMGKTWL